MKTERGSPAQLRWWSGPWKRPEGSGPSGAGTRVVRVNIIYDADIKHVQ